MLWSIVLVVILYITVASAFAQRGPLRLCSQLGAFGRSSQPKREKRDVQADADNNSISPFSPLNIGAASLVGIFATLCVISHTQLEQGKMLQEQSKMRQEEGKMMQERGETLQERDKTQLEQGKMLERLDSRFSQFQKDVSTFSSISTAISTSVVATTYVTRTFLAAKDAANKGRED